MLRFEPGQKVAKYREGRIIDRGEVMEVINEGMARIKYERGIFNTPLGDDIRVLKEVKGAIGFLELGKVGITDADFRGGSPHRRTEVPWTISDEHREQLRPWLEAHGFNADEVIEAQETPDHDGFALHQEYPLP